MAGGRLEEEPDAVAAMLMLGIDALSELRRAALDSEFADRAAGGFAAGRVGLMGVVVFVVGAAVAVVAGSGGVEDLGVSTAEGGSAPMSSTGLFVLFLRDFFFSPPFLLPPSPCIPG